MATDIMEKCHNKHDINMIAPLFLVGFASLLQVTWTDIHSLTSSILGQFAPSLLGIKNSKL